MNEASRSANGPQRQPSSRLTEDVLRIDCVAEVRKVAQAIAQIVGRRLRKRGVVVAMSGGVDSSVCAALAVRALGASKVFGLLMPERESSTASVALAERTAKRLGIPWEIREITQVLDALDCYQQRDNAIRALYSQYGPTWKSKIAIAGGTDGRITFFRLVVQDPEGRVQEARLPHREYLQIVAATNYKQRVRKTIEYHYADRLNYAVVGTPNRLEYDQGFFVKNGDGAADLKPIAHLYKTQVYALAKHLGLPEEVCAAAPTTDSYSMRQGQDEFYFGLPYAQMDVALWAHEHSVPASELADYLGVDEARARFIYQDIERKREATRYLHAAPILIDPVAGIGD